MSSASCYELSLRRLPFPLELPLPVIYKGLKLDCGYRIDLVVSDTVVVEVKAVERLAPSMKPNSSPTCVWAVGRSAFSSTSTFLCCATALCAECLGSLSSPAKTRIVAAVFNDPVVLAPT